MSAVNPLGAPLCHNLATVFTQHRQLCGEAIVVVASNQLHVSIVCLGIEDPQILDCPCAQFCKQLPIIAGVAVGPVVSVKDVVFFCVVAGIA